MALTRSQIERWEDWKLLDLADSWKKFAPKAEDLFKQYKGDVDGEQWTGAAADAAKSRAASDYSTVVAIVDKIDALAARLTQGYDEIHRHLVTGRDVIDDAIGKCYEVAEDLSITGTDEKTVKQLHDQLVTAANAAESADNRLKSDLSAARGELRAAFVSPATLGGDKGKTDGSAVADGQLSPEQAARLGAAGSLTPEQIAALQAGDVATIPASQMEYLNQISRSLDGKSPQEIEAIMKQLPPDAQKGLANSLQIMSNPKVTASVEGDRQVSTNGGSKQLPSGIRESVKIEGLVTKETTSYSSGRSMGIASQDYELHRVEDNQALARIAGSADAQYRNGTDLDRELMDVGRKYLDAEVKNQQSGSWNETISPTRSEATQEIFRAIGDDKVVVREAVTSDTGEKFVRNVLSADWADNGKAASTMFAFGDKDFTVEDTANDADVATAERTADIMEHVGRAISGDEDWKTLSSVEGTNELSVGELNPDLVQTVSKSMAPYVPDLVRDGATSHDNFDVRDKNGSWTDPDDNRTFDGARNLMAVLNTDKTAGETITQAAMQDILANEGRFAANPNDPNAGAYLTNAGRMAGLMDASIDQATQGQYDNQFARDKEAYDRKSAAYDAITALGGEGLSKMPGGQYISTMVDAGGDPLKDAIIGTEPSGPKQDEATNRDYYRDFYNILKASPQLPDSYVQHYPWAFENGKLKDWNELQDAIYSEGAEWDDLETMFRDLSVDHDFGDRFSQAYEQVVE